jgi:hypothetical protein
MKTIVLAALFVVMTGGIASAECLSANSRVTISTDGRSVYGTADHPYRAFDTKPKALQMIKTIGETVGDGYQWMIITVVDGETTVYVPVLQNDACFSLS